MMFGRTRSQANRDDVAVPSLNIMPISKADCCNNSQLLIPLPVGTTLFIPSILDKSILLFYFTTTS